MWKVEAFVTKSRDARANLAVLASTSGFQSGAKDCAQRHNVTLLHVTPSDEVDLSVFGARWGDAVDALHIEAITLEYVGGEKKRLPAMSNELTYYANHTIIEYGNARQTLDTVITARLQTVAQSAVYNDHVFQLEAGTTVVGPKGDEVPLKPLAAIHVRTAVISAKTIHGHNQLDPSILLPEVNVQNVNTGEKTSFKYETLALGIGNSFLPRKFYEAPALGYFYYCEQIKDGLAELYLVESFQHGHLIQAKMTMETKYGDRYVLVTERSTLQRLQQRLDQMKSN